MEEKFLFALEAARQKAAALGVRIRPVEDMKQAHRILSRGSDGFARLADLGRLELTLEALAVEGRYTALFTDEEADTALERLLGAGYRFKR